MKKPILLAPAVVILWAALAAAQSSENITLLFSPNGGCERAIIEAIDRSEKEILVAAYAFSSKPIFQALCRASNRGVHVAIILDKRQPNAHYSIVYDMSQHNINLLIYKKSSKFHIKAIIIDRKILITGSYNFTTSAEKRNVEILVILFDERAAIKATENWMLHSQFSIPFASQRQPVCNNKTCPTMPFDQHHPYPQRRPKRW